MLICKNVNVSDRRTSIRLEEELWAAAKELCVREGMTLHELCTLIDHVRKNSSLTAALRVFLVVYYRLASTEDGHDLVGHGHLANPRPRGADRWRSVIAEVFSDASDAPAQSELGVNNSGHHDPL
ncbi:MAG: ribbon-helix-helix domain-containing protein [Rhodospirillales bacterium]|jgi:predicted DNA-binding ribbon-helix-helix protein|nr:ribbon-helix-helix domain-containing protein [Rhodospirillales bacterium]MBT4006588.1 ribbon-helix-helix domain-containing protein [Rhodospirillales bacterium]MBT5076018.1 ribbon-helix-helix domain-containing protein [Rhodospirillales bacterium]MBT5113866.1 ribbon-helix-helix domain-containing protein [Rhodospirillales bacterium]MBT5672394.1 ribbon-helix-helix domain-containing protein [Rhodospirillales bacterium]